MFGIVPNELNYTESVIDLYKESKVADCKICG